MNRFSRLLGEFSRNSQRAKLTQQLNKKVEAPEANANGTSGYLIKEGKNAGKVLKHLKTDSNNLADPNDRATQESEFGLELRTRDRERKLLRKIQVSLVKIDEGTFGYCEETGEEIGLKRLEARPVATYLSLIHI